PFQNPCESDLFSLRAPKPRPCSKRLARWRRSCTGWPRCRSPKFGSNRSDSEPSTIAFIRTTDHGPRTTDKPLNFTLLKKCLAEALLLFASLGLLLFAVCWLRVFIVTRLQTSQFATIVEQFWDEFKDIW